MRAFQIRGRGGPEVLSLGTVPTPTPGPEELRVRVHAFGVNRADLLQCLGLYPAPPDAPADIPGLEYAGTVEAVGPGCQRYRPGQPVMGILAGGGFAEQVVVPERAALPVPPGLDLVDAAAVPEAFVTSFDALVLQGRMKSGDRVLVHAAASGVGTAATQLASAWGATVLGTGRSEEKLAGCAARHGLANPVLLREGPKFAARVKELTGGAGIDVALDLVGGDYLPETVEVMATGGRILLVGLLAGAQTSLNLGKLLMRRIQLIGTVLRSRSRLEKLLLAEQFEQQVLPLFASGKLHPVVDARLPATQVGDALRHLAENKAQGKTVLTW